MEVSESSGGLKGIGGLSASQPVVSAMKKTVSNHDSLSGNGNGSGSGSGSGSGGSGSGIKKKRKKRTAPAPLARSKIGYLKKKGFFGTWREYYFSLEAGSLMEFKDSKAKKAEKAYMLSDYTVQPAECLTGVHFSLALMNAIDNKTIFLSASNEKEFKEWMGALKSQCRLSKFEQTLENTLKAINDAALLTDDAGIIVSINQPATELFGWTKEELAGKDIKIIMTKDYADKHDEYMSRYKLTSEKRLIGKPRLLPAMRKDGSVFFAELSLGELTDGNQIRYLGTVRTADRDILRSNSTVSSKDQSRNSLELGSAMLAAWGGSSSQLSSPRQTLKKRNPSEIELERQISSLTDAVRLVATEEFTKTSKLVQKYKSRSKKLKKKNTKLQAEIVSLIGDLRVIHRGDQVSSMAFYSSISESEAFNERDMVRYLKGIITNEINHCCSPGTLFRDDSPNTKKITSFILYEGASFVISTLEKPLSELCSPQNSSPSVPTSISAVGSSTNHSSSHHSLKDEKERENNSGSLVNQDSYYDITDPNASEQELRQREKRILDGVFLILNEIKNATKDCPASFGHLFKHLKLEVSKKFLPTSLDPYSIMSSFFFLRLIIPAIVQPQRYNIFGSTNSGAGEEVLSPSISTLQLSKEGSGILNFAPGGVSLTNGNRKGLMLISKILINMANGIVFINEEKMKVFNDAIAKNVKMLHAIFDDIMLMAERGSRTESSHSDSCETEESDLSEDTYSIRD